MEQVGESEGAVTRVRLPFAFAKKHRIAIEQEADSSLTAYITTNTSPLAIAEAQRIAGQPFTVEEVDEETFDHTLTRIYQTDSSDAMQAMEGIDEAIDLARIADEVPVAEDLMESEDEAPIIRLINAILTEAIKENASDIHIETFEKKLQVRFRVDGVLRTVLEPNRKLAPLLVSRIKVMARLDIAEKRVPQDGRIALRVAGHAVDVRVSTMPSTFGERVVLRLLDKQAGRFQFDELGMRSETAEAVKQLLFKPHGIILVTGPTGSGKTTTLYAGLMLLNDQSRNILTVEDPIEYQLDGIGQTQVNPKVDMTFARGLRAILRQDPDVVMVGEIRDLETAQIAVQASLTGHLVLSTLHTNSAVGAITRLHDMGIEPFLISSSLLGVLAQRLVRKLCPHCKQPYQPDAHECELIGVDPASQPTFYRPVGCEHCNYLGYRGRQGIYELLPVNDAIRRLIHAQAGEQTILEEARKIAPSIRADGRARVLEG
ncbi:MAG: type II secretion system protein GspE, partial [Gammaproteobacteria bacterium]